MKQLICLICKNKYSQKTIVLLIQPSIELKQANICLLCVEKKNNSWLKYRWEHMLTQYNDLLD